MSRNAVACLIFAAFSVLPPAFAATEQQPQFRSGVQLIEVDAVVVDDKGQLVTGLSREDFEVREDGHLMPIATFVSVSGGTANQQQSRFILLLVDDLTTEVTLTTKIKEVARMFAQRMGSHDTVAVVPVDGGQATTSTNPEQVLAAIDRLKPHWHPVRPGLERQVLQTMAELMNQMEKVHHRRKTLVSIGSAKVFNPSQSSDYDPLWTDTIRAAARANVSLYVIDPNGLTGGRYDAARTVVEATGGQAFVNSNLFEHNVEQIWSEAGHYYLLGYEPLTSKARMHTIEVRVKRSGLQVRARRTRA